MPDRTASIFVASSDIFLTTQIRGIEIKRLFGFLRYSTVLAPYDTVYYRVMPV